MKRLNAQTHPNAAAVLLRVLIELSVDELIESKGIIVNGQHQQRRSTLAEKINSAIEWLRNSRLLNKQAAEMIKKLGGADDASLGNSTASVSTLHSFMHNRHASPISSELNAIWNGIEPFMGALFKACK